MLMKKAFTLVEMLIVVAILAVLMSIVFRLGSLGGEDSRRSATVVRLQKIENCLSGYYAAFGSYPPVKVHGWRDIYHSVDENGDQEDNSNSTFSWGQVNAACRSQPFTCEYPGNSEDNEVIEEWSAELQARANNASEYPYYAKSEYVDIFRQGFGGADAGSGFRSEWDNSDWKAIKLFKFGLMSYLLPRYLFMMGGDEEFFASGNPCAQWEDNNDMPCDPFEGDSFSNWSEIRSYSHVDDQTGDSSSWKSDLARVANIPSQAVCARWMPNLEYTCRTLRTMKFFGIQINDPDYTGLGLDDEYPPDPGTHYPPNGSTPYRNAEVTVYDGWHRVFYYYSPAPYQAYTLWSAGSNGKTFPPWMSLDKLNASDRKQAVEWMSDDIMQMSH